jgi:hypothetical protein
LTAGEIQELTSTHTFTTAGAHSIWAYLDGGCGVLESDENNNLLGPITVTVQSPGLIFADGFESGDLSAWSSCATDGGDLRVTAESALVGDYGLQARLDDNRSIYCTADQPDREKIFRARVYFDPNSIRMAEGNTHRLLEGWGGSQQVLRGEFRRSAGRYRLRLGLLTDAGAWKYTPWMAISDARHLLEFSWRAATRSGMNNGRLAVWLDGRSKTGLSGIDNDSRQVDRVRLGALGGIDSGTRGLYFFDEFFARRTDEPIGP